MTLVLVSIFGGAGALARFVVDGTVRTRMPSTIPWATMLINVTGSFVLGLVTGLVADHGVAEAVSAAVGTGFCGGYTTFSTMSFETVRLLEQGDRRAALVSGGVTLAACLLAAAAGLALAAI
jgi:fluoride exporter